MQYLSPFGGPQDGSRYDRPLRGGAKLALPKAEMLHPPVNLKAETKLKTPLLPWTQVSKTSESCGFDPFAPTGQGSWPQKAMLET